MGASWTSRSNATRTVAARHAEVTCSVQTVSCRIVLGSRASTAEPIPQAAPFASSDRGIRDDVLLVQVISELIAASRVTLKGEAE